MSWSPIAAGAALRTALTAPSGALGGWIALGDPLSTEIVAQAGYDWIGIDAQHGISGATLPTLVLAAGSTPVLVRVASDDPARIGRALDAGAAGVIVPLVESAAQARAAVAACRHPPAGTRSWGTTRSNLGLADVTPASANTAAFCAVMAETVGAVEAIDAIAATEGLDAVFVGPADLGISAGRKPGDVADFAERIVEACAAAGVIAGIYAGGPESAATWNRLGFRLLAMHNDAQLLHDGARAQLAAARELVGT
jgi:4-hydroxy-2-oxoheptanedioate aldolase